MQVTYLGFLLKLGPYDEFSFLICRAVLEACHSHSSGKVKFVLPGGVQSLLPDLIHFWTALSDWESGAGRGFGWFLVLYCLIPGEASFGDVYHLFLKTTCSRTQAWNTVVRAPGF